MKTIQLEPITLGKNCNEALILAILAEGKQHGYQLALELEERSGGYFRFNHGTLYPILHKLEREGFIRGIWMPENPGRKRRLYTLTNEGRRYCAAQADAWKIFFERIFEVMKGVKE